MIVDLFTYQLHNVGKYALNKDIDTLFSVLYYKPWRLLAGEYGTLKIEFLTNNRFQLSDKTHTSLGGWKVFKQKHLVLTFNNEIFYCHVAYYDGVMLILKVYGEQRFVVLIAASVQLPTCITASDIEAYIAGNKNNLAVNRSQANDTSMKKKGKTKHKKVPFIETLNKILLCLLGTVILISTYFIGFPFYGSVLFAGFLTFCCYGVSRTLKTKQVLVAVILSLLILFCLFFIYLFIPMFMSRFD